MTTWIDEQGNEWTVEEIRKRLAKARKVVSELCNGEREWTMRIPADPEHDPDLIIDASLRDIDKLLARVEELERSKLDIIKSFVEEVERMAESKMLKTGKLEGAHYNAMKKRLKEIEAEIAEVEQ